MSLLEKPAAAGRNSASLVEPWRAKQEAERCLGCYDAPCISGCPTRINIPEFIGRIRTANLAGAYQTLIQQNPLPAVCGLVCPTEYLCEEKCVVKALSGKPVEIAALQYFVCTQAQVDEIWPTTRNERLAVIGAGPAGIACALSLRQNGYPVDLFDGHELPGGLMMYSIPNYRLPDQAVAAELARLKDSGIHFRLGELVDTESLREIISKYQAVFLGIGLSSAKDLNPQSSELEGVYSALDYLEKMRRAERGECERPALKGKVAVIGGGNVALDAACVAARGGAERVSVLYRRTCEQMPAWESEYQDALALGIEFHWLTGLNQILGDSGKITFLRLQKMRLMNDLDASGRQKVESIDGLIELLECDAVIMAVGQALDFDGLSELGIDTSEERLVQVNPATYQTSHPKVFAGGDAVNGGTYVVQAVADGRQAAEAIHRYLNGDLQS